MRRIRVRSSCRMPSLSSRNRPSSYVSGRGCTAGHARHLRGLLRLGVLYGASCREAIGSRATWSRAHPSNEQDMMKDMMQPEMARQTCWHCTGFTGSTARAIRGCFCDAVSHRRIVITTITTMNTEQQLRSCSASGSRAHQRQHRLHQRLQLLVILAHDCVPLPLQRGAQARALLLACMCSSGVMTPQQIPRPCSRNAY